MKKIIAITLMSFFAYDLYAQLNMGGSEIKEQLQAQKELQVLGRQDLIDKDFIPLENIEFLSPNQDFSFWENIVGLKTYIISELCGQLCVNKAQNMVAYKALKPGYYDVVGIIRFTNQFNQHEQEIKQLGLVPAPEIEIQRKERTGVRHSISEILSWDLAQCSHAMMSAERYIENYVVNGKSTGSSDPFHIVLLQNDKNEIYYMFRGLPKNRIDIPYYESVSKLKGQDVAIYTENVEYIRDYITKQPFVNKLNKVDDISRYRPNKHTRPGDNLFINPTFIKCSDIFVSEEGYICGLFENEQTKFSVKLYGKRLLQLLDSNSFSGEYPIYNYSGTKCSIGEIFTRETIEEYQKMVDAVKRKNRQAIQAIAAAKARQKAEYERIQNERKAGILMKYGEKFGGAIIRGQVLLGMTQEMCKEALGHPCDRFNTITSLGTTSVWFYNYKTYLYFRDGKLVTIKN